MIVSSGLMFLPTSLVLDHEPTSSDEELVGHVAMEATETATESVSASDINNIAPDLALQTEHAPRAGFRPITRGVIKPLVALITAQYVIVTALTAGVAVTVAHHGSQLINEKFAAIVTALKRF